MVFLYKVVELFYQCFDNTKISPKFILEALNQHIHKYRTMNGMVQHGEDKTKHEINMNHEKRNKPFSVDCLRSYIICDTTASRPID